MADVTAPKAAPMHHDVREDFASFQVFLAMFAGATAVIAGIVLGILLVND